MLWLADWLDACELEADCDRDSLLLALFDSLWLLLLLFDVDCELDRLELWEFTALFDRDWEFDDRLEVPMVLLLNRPDTPMRICWYALVDSKFAKVGSKTLMTPVPFHTPSDSTKVTPRSSVLDTHPA